MTTDVDFLQLNDQIRGLRNALNNGKLAIADAKNYGTNLYQNPNLTSTFPTSSTAYKAWLLNAQTAINNFISSFPAEPPLSG